MEQPNKIKHLELIQGTVTRMAQNSFWVKGVAITLITAIFVLCQNIDKWYIFDASNSVNIFIVT